MPRSARRRSRAGRRRAWRAPLLFFACRVRQAPAAMAGTGFSPPSSIIARGPAISSRSCRGWMSICAGPRLRDRRHDRAPSRLIDKFQYNGLTEPYEVTAKLGKPRYCRGYQTGNFFLFFFFRWGEEKKETTGVTNNTDEG